jgi:methionyl-tRNA formyltransferase
MSIRNIHVLFLGYTESETRIIQALRNFGCTVDVWTEKLDNLNNYDVVISFGYKYILTKQTLLTARRKPINLHISFLPFNRGMHPNFWAHFDGTPSGISIHYIEEGIDTGEIIFQKKVKFHPNEKTFKQTWTRLKFEIEELFITNIEEIILNKFLVSAQQEGGTLHLKSDLPKEFLGWDSDITKEIERLRNIIFE